MRKIRRILFFIGVFLFANLFANLTFAKAPDFCKETANSENKACFASAQEYCNSESNASRRACVAANREYCNLERFANSPACFASHPAFCTSSSSTFSTSLACVGANPKDYCSARHHSSEPICYGAMPDYCETDTLRGNDPACSSYFSNLSLSLYCQKFDGLSLCP